MLLNNIKSILFTNTTFLQPLRQFKRFPLSYNEEKLKDESFDITKELTPPKLTEEEIALKRHKHRLPERVYRIFVNKEALPIENEYDFKQNRLRSYYGRHGKASKLNPGILWPTKEELQEILEYDKLREPPLAETLKKIETERLAEENRKKEVEAEVDAKMALVDKAIADYYAKIEKQKNEAHQQRLKRERLIDEVSEYLGYEIDHKDPRFQEAVEQREKEQKKALKAKKQQESYDKMLAKLKAIAETENK